MRRVEPPDGAVNRRFYRSVGGLHAWTDHRDKDAAWWQAHARAGRDVGARARRPATTSSHAVGDDVEIAYFGLLPAFQGRGLGGALLEHALRRGFELGSRVWVHTCTLDGPYALANYRARGLESYRVDR